MAAPRNPEQTTTEAVAEQISADVKAQGGTGGGGQKPEPAGKAPPRSYRVLADTTAPEEDEHRWTDFGRHPGTSQETAIKKARQASESLRKLLSEGRRVVAVPESYFEPLVVTVETVEVESFKKAKP